MLRHVALLLFAVSVCQGKMRGEATLMERNGALYIDCDADPNQPGCNFFTHEAPQPIAPRALRILRPHNNSKFRLNRQQTNRSITIAVEIFHADNTPQDPLDIFVDDVLVARVANPNTTKGSWNEDIIETVVRTNGLQAGSHRIEAVYGDWAGRTVVSVVPHETVLERSNYLGNVHSVNDSAFLGYREDQRMELMSLVAGAHDIRTVCETGLWMGGSARTWLQNPSVEKVYSFDIKIDQNVAGELWRDFGRERFEVIEGDSFYTLPQFAHDHPDVTCDLVLIDGDHFDELPFSDMRNFQRLANENTILFCDDCGTTSACLWCTETTVSFSRLVKENRVKELARIQTREGNWEEGYHRPANANHHICVGRYAFRDTWVHSFKGSAEDHVRWKHARDNAGQDIIHI